WDKLNEESEDKYVMLVIYLAMLSIGISLAPLLMLPGAVIFLVWVGWKKHKDLSVSLVAFSVFFAFLYLAITKESLMVFIVGSILTAISVTLCDYMSKDVKVNYRKIYTYLGIYIGLAILGLSPHLMLIIRARANPYINIAAPTTFRGLWDVFNRKQYGPLVLLPRQTDNGIGTFAALFEQFKMFFKYYTWQFGGYFRNEIAAPSALMRIIPSLLMAIFTATGLYGIYVHFKKDKKTFIFIMTTLFLLSAGFVVYLNMKYSPSDPIAAHQPREVRERDYFYMPAYFMFMAFFAFGLRELIVSFKSKSKELKERFSPGLFTLPQWILLALVILIAVSPFFANINSYANRRNNWIADEYAKNMLNTPRPNSIIFTNGDNDTYPLWFEQVVRDYRSFEPGKKGVLVVNLSLLNVEWYIKQMQSFGVPISMTDREIEQLRPVRLQNNEILMIRDIVIRDIIHTNSTGRRTPRSLLYASKDEFNEKVLTHYRPDSINIYFSVTVSEDARSKYRENLILEGLGYRITSDSEAQQYPRNVDVATTKENIWEKYSYDYILNEDIYVDENVDRIMTNYAAGFLQLGIYYSEIDSLRKAVEHFRQGREFYTYDRNSVTMNIARVLIEMEEYEEAEDEIRKAMGNSDDPQDKATMTAVLSEIYLSKGDYERAEEIYDSILKKNPEEPAGYAGKLRVYRMKGQARDYENTKSILMRN
ncbi:MAG: hypothetical protein SVK54_00780, partial [candidate division WOR-3 bacterium]|nr:hypothetical protein [candidate division WOR-3 bacterium]